MTSGSRPGPVSMDSLHFSTTGYGADKAFVAELARVSTIPYPALNSGEFSYEW